MDKISFSDGIGIAGLILALILVVLDKTGKLKGSLPLILLGIAALMTIPLALSVPWVAHASSELNLWMRRLLMLTAVLFSYLAIAVWITNDVGGPEAGAPPPSSPGPNKGNGPTGTVTPPAPPKVAPPVHHPTAHHAKSPITVTGVQVSQFEVGKKITLQLLLRNDTGAAFEMKTLTITGIQPFYDDVNKDGQMEDYLWALIDKNNGTRSPLVLPSRNESIAFTTESVALTQEMVNDLQTVVRVAYFLIQIRDKDGTIVLNFCGHTSKDGRFDYCRAHNGP